MNLILISLGSTLLPTASKSNTLNPLAFVVIDTYIETTPSYLLSETLESAKILLYLFILTFICKALAFCDN